MRKIETIDSLIGALDRDVPAVLVIVVETAGSAPREPGAWMAVFDDGRIEGTVGGGAVGGPGHRGRSVAAGVGWVEARALYHRRGAKRHRHGVRRCR